MPGYTGNVIVEDGNLLPRDEGFDGGVPPTPKGDSDGGQIREDEL